jgi:predicted dehydrogenase
MNRVGVAIVGAGAFAELHMAAYAELDDAEVVAVVDIDPRRAAAAARVAGGVPWALSIDDVLQRPDVLAVDICTPNFTHAPLAVTALEAGKHVLVEKPPALSLADYDRMVDAAERSGATLNVGLVMRHTPWARSIRSEIDSGSVGAPRLVRIGLQSGVIWPGGTRAWQRNRALSGGHVVHNGMHLIDLAGWFLDDRPIEVMARGFRVGPTVDDHWTLTVRYASGAVAMIEYSYTLPDPDGLIVEATVLGDDGALRFSSLDSPIAHTARGDHPLFDFRGDSMKRELAEFVLSVRTGESHGVGHRVVRAALATALSGQRSVLDAQAHLVGEEVRHD